MDLRNFTNFKRYENKAILAIDYGSKVVGLATFTPGRDPFPLLHGKIIVENEEQVLSELKQTIDDEAIEVLIIGLPLLLDGKESTLTEEVRKFAKLVETTFPSHEIHLQDETLSSYEAEDRMKKSPQFNFKVDRTQIDAMAASIILEDFIKKS